MAEPSLNADPSDDPSGAPASDQDDGTGAPLSPSRAKQFKLLLILGGALLGGSLLGVGIVMALLSFLQPAAPDSHSAGPHATQSHSAPVVAEPKQDHKQIALNMEMEELKAKNEKLEEQLKQLSQSAPVSPFVAAREPTTIHNRRSAKAKSKVAADCTVPVKGEKLSDRLKSCIEDFNAVTN